MSIGLYIVLAPLYLKSVRKLQEKRFVFVKILAIIIPENGAKVSKIKCFQFAQQTLIRQVIDDGSVIWPEMLMIIVGIKNTITLIVTEKSVENRKQYKKEMKY